MGGGGDSGSRIQLGGCVGSDPGLGGCTSNVILWPVFLSSIEFAIGLSASFLKLTLSEIAAMHLITG